MDLVIAFPQPLSRVSSPTFANLTLTGATLTGGTNGLNLAAGGSNKSIVLTPSGIGQIIAGINGLATTPVYSFTNASGYGMYYPGGTQMAWAAASALALVLTNNKNLLLGGLSTDGTGVLQLPVATTAAGGITLGADMNIYRGAANTLRIYTTAADAFSLVLGGTSGDGPILSFAAGTTTLNSSRGSGVIQLQTNAGNNAQVLDASGNTTFSGKILSAGSFKRVTAQFDMTSNTTLTNVTGLSVSLEASKSYLFRAVLLTVSNVAGGVKAAVAYSGTVTKIDYEGFSTNAGAVTQSRGAASGTAVGAVTAVTAALVEIEGTIVTNSAGNLTIQFAQNASNGAASSVIIGSYMEVCGF